MLPSVAKSSSPPTTESTYHEEFPVLAPRPRKGFVKNRSENKRKQAKEVKQNKNLPSTASNTEPEKTTGLTAMNIVEKDSSTPTTFSAYAYEDFPTFTPRSQTSVAKSHSETSHRVSNGEKLLQGSSKDTSHTEKKIGDQENPLISKFNDKCLQRRILKSENRLKGNIISCRLCLRRVK